MTGPSSPPVGEAVGRQEWLTLAVLCSATLMIVLDVTIVNVALPSIQEDLGFSQAALAWTVNAYLISFGGLLLLAGRLGDLRGHKQVFLVGLLVFGIASLACGLSETPAQLVAARFAQGAGGAMASAVILAIIVMTFTTPADRARAIALYGFVSAVGSSLGLVIGGALTTWISWHWIFIVNVPLALAASALGWRWIEVPRPARQANGADVAGALLVVGCLMTAVYTIVSRAQEDGWLAASTLTGVAISAGLLVLLVWREATTAAPLIPLAAIRSRGIVIGNLLQGLVVASTFGMFFLGALYLQHALGYDAIHVGLAFLPMTVSVGVVSLFLAARLAERFGDRAVVAAGLAFVAGGLLLLVGVDADGVYLIDVLPGLLLVGVGVGAANPLLVSVAMSGVGPRDAGLASGLFNTTTMTAAALGLAFTATFATDRTEQLTQAGARDIVALTAGYRLAFAVSAGLAAVAVCLALAALRERAPDRPPGHPDEMPSGPGAPHARPA